MLKNTLTKIRSKKGFTLMEMLIVVAIIAILVAIAIPTFTSSLNKAKLAADDANFRSAKAVATVANLNTQYGAPATGDTTVTAGQYFQKDGTFGAVGTAYAAQADGTDENHKVGSTIKADGAGGVSWVKKTA